MGVKDDLVTAVLEIDTSFRATFDRSSNSSMSNSTLGSEAFLSSEAEEDIDSDDDLSMEPKLEEDESTLIESIKRLDESESPEEKYEGSSKKRRGRPKKVSSPSSTSANKIAKGRSKTGCITCRRRKKKCDETKPECLNCQKNAIVCQGYPRREIWKSGKQRSEEIRRYSFTIPTSLPILVEGIETDVDRRFLNHFIFNLSGVLTVHDQNSNPFKDLLLPMATEHKGLMHSLMALSGSHIVATEPSPALNERQLHHFDSAITTLNADIAAAIASGRESNGLIVEDPTVASTIVHSLICICKGSTNGEYRIHMNGTRQLLSGRKSKNPDFQRFISEFFRFHDVLNSLTSLDRRPSLTDDSEDHSLPEFMLKPAIQPGAGLFISVLKGLFRFITRITALRDSIRTRKERGQEPTVLYENFAEAVMIDAGIRDWNPDEEPGTSRWIAAQLYRQCVWVYLYRTIQASRPSEKISSAVDDGIKYLRALPPNESTQCILLLPLFILSCAAFEPRQRPDLENAYDNLQAYSNLGNIKIARQIVRKVWERMDVGDEKSWDWEGIMYEMGIDLLVT